MRRIDSIVIHYTASPDVSLATIEAWHRAKGYDGIGYHAVVRRDGMVEWGRSENEVGAHCYRFNQNSLGVCLTGSDSELWYPADAQYTSLQSVLIGWQAKYSVPSANIFLHREKYPTRCPGRLDKVRALSFARNVIEAPSPAKTTPRGNQGQRPVLPVLRLSARNDAVKLLQARLHAHHADAGPIDGVFGGKTRRAVLAFQRARKIVVDGIVGPTTWALLMSAPG